MQSALTVRTSLGGMKWRRGSGKRKERKQRLTMEDLEDDEVADEHFR